MTVKKLDRARKWGAAWSIGKVLLFVIPILFAFPYLRQAYDMVMSTVGTVQSITSPSRSSSFRKEQSLFPNIDPQKILKCLQNK